MAIASMTILYMVPALSMPVATPLPGAQHVTTATPGAVTMVMAPAIVAATIVVAAAAPSFKHAHANTMP